MRDELHKAFMRYALNYDLKDPRIGLKVSHMYRVEKIARFIASKLGLSSELVEVADAIGLLHDIGRFYQIKCFGTFADHESIDHAEASNIVLFDEGHLEEIVGKKMAASYGELIRKAIYHHNKIALPEDTADFTSEELTLAKLIRDADKIDIFKILLESDCRVIFKLADGANPGGLSPEIEEAFYKKGLIDYRLRKSYVDDCVTKLAYVFDFNFGVSCQLLLKTRYLERLVDNLFEQVDVKDEETRDRLYGILDFATNYLRKI